MSAEQFKDLSKSLCELLGIAPVPLGVDHRATRVFQVTISGFVVSFLHSGRCPDSGFIVMELGPLPANRGAEAWLELMELNYEMLGKDTPCFSRNPESGHVMLQCAFDLRLTTAQSLHEQCVAFAEAGRNWMRGLLFAESAGSDALSREFV